MQDNNMDKVWRDKLGGYQAPADPQDWADMAAMLDAKDEKRAGFFWWWMIAAALFVTVGGGLFHLMQVQSEQIDAFAISGGNGGNDGAGTNTASTENNSADDDSELITNEINNLNNNAENDPSSSSSNNNENTNTNNNFIKPDGNNTTNSGSASNTKNTRKVQPSVKKNKSKKGDKNNKNSTNYTGNGNVNNNSLTNSPANNGITPSRSNSNGNITNTAGTNTNSDSYDKPVGTISVKRLKELPNPLTLTLSKDTNSIFNDHVWKKRSVVQHYLGLSTGWSASRVDRSGDFRSGYNVGLQYTMMVKNRAGFHVGTAFRSYSYFTDLVTCNYDIYQCPNSYSSNVKVIDLNVGVQVNLVKTDKVEWYVMGGVNNQFMLEETFEYNLPKIDTINPAPIPQIPPTNTSFNGGGASDFESYMDDNNIGSSSIVTGGSAGNGKFLRERYLGAWYAGTGVTWHFANRMNLQVEPVIGRSFQFVGIQDKKLWQSGVNVRMNVRLGR